jgi:large repetitive protein
VDASGCTPTIASFSPLAGFAGCGVTINGTNLVGANVVGGTGYVKFGGTDATSFTVVSPEKIEAFVGAGADGPVTVRTGQGAAILGPATSAPTNFDHNALGCEPASITFSPTSGPVGTLVTITGENLLGTTSVQFGTGTTVTSTGVNVVDSTHVAVLVPAGALTGPITVTTGAGVIASGAIFSVGSGTPTPPAPTISNVTPTTGVVGTSVTITGTNLTGATVRFNGVAASVTSNTGIQIITSVPAGAATGPLTVTTTGGTVSGGTFTVPVSAPTITSFTPTSGLVGTPVTITGTNLGGASSVKFNGVAAVIGGNTSTTITTTVPATATTGPITVTTAGGTATSPTNFTVGSPPTITSFSPTSGPVGTEVTITGTNLDNATAVRFGGVSATITSHTATQVVATVPVGALTGPITVTTPGGTATSGTNFTVTLPAPTITSFTPSRGRVGDVVSITGTNFTGVTVVKFNGVPAITFAAGSATLITATLPTGASAGPISVTAQGGTALSSSNFVVRHARAVTLNLPGAKAKGTVSVSDAFAACRSSVVVKLQHFKNGAWKTVASLRTGSSGAYGVGHVTASGKYRARANEVTLATGDVCLAATSAIAKS